MSNLFAEIAFYKQNCLHLSDNLDEVNNEMQTLQDRFEKVQGEYKKLKREKKMQEENDKFFDKNGFLQEFHNHEKIKLDCSFCSTSTHGKYGDGLSIMENSGEEKVSGIRDVSVLNEELEQITMMSELMSATSIREIDETFPKLAQINPLTFHNFMSQVEMADKNKAKKIKEIIEASEISD